MAVQQGPAEGRPGIAVQMDPASGGEMETRGVLEHPPVEGSNDVTGNRNAKFYDEALGRPGLVSAKGRPRICASRERLSHFAKTTGVGFQGDH